VSVAMDAAQHHGRDHGHSRKPSGPTEGIHTPEGGRRTASGASPAPARQWPILLVFGGVALGFLIAITVGFRVGALVIGAALLTGAVLRMALANVGLLAVRSRFTDVITLGVLGAGIVLLALTVMPDPWLQIPWLTDVMRFIVR
jgi:Protein of unknown function (DUF3017)